MKITENYPKLLKLLYDNCDDNLYFCVTTINNDVSFTKPVEEENIIFTVPEYDVSTFLRCYKYACYAGYIYRTDRKDGSLKDGWLTDKAIDFVEKHLL